MNLVSGVRSAFRGGPTYAAGVRNLSQQSLRELPAAELYAVLRAMYLSNGLYDELSSLAHLRNVWAPALKGLRNPTFRSVEFYASKVLGCEMEIETENKAIIPAIEQVWKWSNFDNLSTVLSRHLAMLGDVFVQVAMRPDRSRVYFQMIDPAYVVDWDEDERGNIVWLRIEQPMTERGPDGKASAYLHVEVWDKELGTYRRWKVTDARARIVPLDILQDLKSYGPPTEEISFAAMGIAWVPFVHARFRDIGEPRGVAAIMPAYDKIHEANLMATRLHQLLFRHGNVTQAIQSAGRDPNGRPIPPPAIGGVSTDDGTITLGDDNFLRLPAGWELAQLVPQLPYAEALAILNDHMQEIARDLPELAYYSLRDKGDLSGVAVRLLLGDAEDRALEARGNLEATLVRADQMALTMGATAGLFPSLGGTYENGAFEHSFEKRQIFEETEQEEATTELAQAQAFQTWTSAGLPRGEALKRAGYTEEEAADLMTAQADAVEAGGEQ